MTKGKRGRKKKNALPQELIDTILSMNPQDLAAEAAREQISFEALKKQLKEDPQIEEAKVKVEDFKNQVVGFVKEADKIPAVALAKEAYKKAKEEHINEEHQSTLEALIDAQGDLKALKQSWNEDLKRRKETVKFMMKTLKSHLESGALKTKL